MMLNMRIIFVIFLHFQRLVDGVWSFGGESSLVLGFLGHDSSWEWEFDVWVVHGFVLWSSALVGFDLFGSEDLDGTWSGSMPGSISRYIWVTASGSEMSRYSRYMFSLVLLESYLIQIP